MTLVNDSAENTYTWLPSILIGILLGIIAPLLLPQIGITGSLVAGEKAAWFLTRSSGTVAYLTLTASTIWGLLLSTKLIKQNVPAPITLAMHNFLSWISLGLTVVHAAVLLFDTYYSYSLTALLIPFAGPYSPVWVGLGTLGFYIMLITTLSFYVRKRIGQKTWRKLHYTTFLGYIFATLHGWMAGTDALQLASMYGISTLLVFFLTIVRILTAKASKRR